jgi:hypothetical protein
MKEDVLVVGLSSRWLFTEVEVLSMSILFSDLGWACRDTAEPNLRVQSFIKRNGHLLISVSTNDHLDGTGRWFYHGQYSAERVKELVDRRILS